MTGSIRSILGEPETAQYAELNADEPVVLTHYNRPVAVLIGWETWVQMKKALEGK